jgi:tetratricopeptide (TPR) repeat protein
LSNSSIPDANPTPDFYARSMTIVNRWQTGELPFQEAIEATHALGREALASNHLANQGRVEQLLGYLQSLRGNLNTSIQHYERSRAFYSQVGNQRRIAICDLNLGEAYRYKGDFNRARALFDKAYQSFKELGDLEHEALSIGNRGQMLLSMGQHAAARADLLESYRLARQMPLDAHTRTELFCEIHHALALLYLLENRVDKAWSEAKQAYSIALEVNQPLECGFANRAVAEVLTVMDTPPGDGFSTDPDTYYTAANEAFREINAEGEMARTMFAHAKSLARRGRRMTAARKLQLAMVIFTRLGMVDDAAKAAEAQLQVL